MMDLEEVWSAQAIDETGREISKEELKREFPNSFEEAECFMRPDPIE